MTGSDRNYEQTRYMLGGYEIELHHPGGIRTWLLPSREVQLAQLAAIMTTHAVTVTHDKEVQSSAGLDTPRRLRQIRLEHVAVSDKASEPGPQGGPPEEYLLLPLRDRLVARERMLDAEMRTESSGRAIDCLRAAQDEVTRMLDLIDAIMTGRSGQAAQPSNARILEVARKIGEHWRVQEGVNGALLDELAQLTKEG